MESSDEGRSISGGISFPQWMKTKIGDRYDLDQATFSPPAEDDSFFFIRYPKAMQQPDFGDLCNTKKPKPAPSNKQSNTLPCERFLAEVQAEGGSMAKQLSIGKQFNVNADDGYKSDVFECGKSVVTVAHNMVTNNLFGYRGPSPAEKSKPEKNSSFNRQRRNSKSLPASPLASPKTSPKLRRKNPYFSDPFRKSNENFGKSGWLLANILSQRASIEDLTSGTESEADSPHAKRRTQDKSDTIHIFNNETKPAELREMNFWSPTSM